MMLMRVSPLLLLLPADDVYDGNDRDDDRDNDYVNVTSWIAFPGWLSINICLCSDRASLKPISQEASLQLYFSYLTPPRHRKQRTMGIQTPLIHRQCIRWDHFTSLMETKVTAPGCHSAQSWTVIEEMPPTVSAWSLPHLWTYQSNSHLWPWLQGHMKCTLSSKAGQKSRF